MIMKNKKGISPLIATVLAIGFAIVLAVLFWIFASEQVEQVLDKDAAQQSGMAICAKDVAFSIPSCTVGPPTSVTIHNTGDMPITAFRLRVAGEFTTGNNIGPFTWTPLVENEVAEGAEKTITKSFSSGETFMADGNVEVMPVIVYGGHAITCTEQSATCVGS